MKYLLFLLISLTFVATECHSVQDKSDFPEANKNKKMEMQKKRIGDLEYSIKIEKVSDTFFRFNYEVKNLGESDYLLYNRGTSLEMRSGVVFVEPQTDETVELSQKRFFEPKDKNCPDRETPIYPAASLLKAQQTIKEEISISLPLKLHTPFADCEPQLTMPKETKKIRFCLGVAKVNSDEKIRADKQGIIIVRGGENIAKQQFLCSDIVELN